MRVLVHQPEHLPWCGLLARIDAADLFVVLDTVQYRRRYFQNRNRILGRDGQPRWLTVPVKDDGRDTRIQDVRIDNSTDWRRRHFESLRHEYNQHPWWDLYEPELRRVYAAAWDRLADLNLHLIELFLSFYELRSRCLRASGLGVEGEKGGLMLDLARAVRATTYLAGPGEREYLDAGAFAAAGIALEPFDYVPVPYEQRRPEGTTFQPYLSSIDLLMNRGPLAKGPLRAGVRR